MRALQRPYEKPGYARRICIDGMAANLHTITGAVFYFANRRRDLR
jgi:hypothetical protein